MVTLVHLGRQDEAAARRLEVLPAQRAFVDPVADTLARLGPGEDPHVVKAGDSVVGFFVINRHYETKYDHALSGALGLEEFSIGAAHQGRGHGKAALRALPGYLRAAYCAYRLIQLTVNCRNPVARDIYLAGGFIDEGALYRGGRSGPQHILQLTLTG